MAKLCDIKPGSKYAVYRSYRNGAFVWADDGDACEREFLHGGASFAVRVLGVEGNDVIGTDAHGTIMRVPAHAIGSRFSDVAFRPGAVLSANGRSYLVDFAAECKMDLEIGTVTEMYKLTAGNGHKIDMFRTEQGFYLGENRRHVAVRRTA